MKKPFTFVFFLLGFVALVGFMPIKADDIVNYGNVPTVTPTLTSTQVKEHDTIVYLTEFLRQGGTIDFSNVTTDYNFNDFCDDFLNSLDNLLNGQKRWSSVNDLAVVNSYNLTALGINSFIDTYRNNLLQLSPSSDEPSTPTPSPNSDYISYINRINNRSDNTSEFWFYNFPMEWRDSNTTYTLNYYPPSNYTWIANASNYTTSNQQSYTSNNVSPIDILIFKCKIIKNSC